MTEQQKQRIVELAQVAERFMGRGKFGLLSTPPRMQAECLRSAERASVEAFRIAQEDR